MRRISRAFGSAVVACAVLVATLNACSIRASQTLARVESRNWSATSSSDAVHTRTETTPVTAPSPPAAPGPYRAISDRQWSVIAKDPDSHVGEEIVVYGTITQFDAATGDSVFRANVAGTRQTDSFNYEINTILVGLSADQLTDFVVDDVFRASVTVLGSLTYDTQVGGSTTAPELEIDKIAHTS